MSAGSMKLGVKLPLSFMLVLGLAIGAALVGFWRLDAAIGAFSVDVAAVVQQEREVRAMETDFKEQVQEWKNVLLRGKDPAQLQKYWSSFESQEAQVSAAAKTLHQRVADEAVKSTLARFATAHEAMGRNYRKGLEVFKAADFAPDKGDAAVKGMDREPAKLIEEAALAIAKNAAQASEVALASSKAVERACVIGLVLIACIGLAVGVLVSRSVVHLLGGEPADATAAAQAIARGDLSTALKTRPGDKNSLMGSLVEMQGSLGRLVSGVRAHAEGVATASAQIAQGNTDLSSRTEEQASALEQTAAAMEQLNTTVSQNADNAKQANQLAIGASAVAVKGGEVVSQVVDTMKGINQSSKQIAEIIGVIDGIAFQTNILALNAAVEAARAGEQGRGFAVVASEVRSLAQRSAEAARQIKSLITASVQRVDEGTALVDQAGATMNEVVSSIQRVAHITGEISNASVEQSAGVAQVGEAVSQMDRATQQNAALVEEAAAAADSLKHQAGQLVSGVSVFKVMATAA